MTAGANIDDGTVDMVIAHMASQMSAKYTYSDSYYTEECILVVKTGTSAFALKSFTVGYIQSNRLRKTAEDITLKEYLAAGGSQSMEKRAYASYPDMLSALDRGEIGGAVLPRQVFNELRTQYPITETTLVIGVSRRQHGAFGAGVDSHKADAGFRGIKGTLRSIWVVAKNIHILYNRYIQRNSYSS